MIVGSVLAFTVCAPQRHGQSLESFGAEDKRFRRTSALINRFTLPPSLSRWTVGTDADFSYMPIGD
jgi:hypothetical protein